MNRFIFGAVIAATSIGVVNRARAHGDHINSKSQPLPQWVIEIPAADKVVRSKVADMGYAIDEVLSDKIFVTGSDKDVSRLRHAGFAVKTREFKEQYLMFQNFGPGYVYHSYAQVMKELQDLSTLYPQIVTLDSLGTTHEDRDVGMIRISGLSKAQAETEQAPVVLYTGCHHAREHLSVEVPLLFAKYLASEYASGNPAIKELVDSREIYIAPIINPDGHVYDFVSGSSSGRMWRKNRRHNGGTSYGVDLNRNYGFGWGEGGSSTNSRSDVYMGPAPFSEPETQNVRNFVDAQPRMTTLLSFHTFSELVLYPWGHTYDSIGEKIGDAEDLPVFEKMATDMARWNNYTPQQSSDLYIASGDTTDWAYGAHGIFAFTFELSPKSMWEGGFYPGTGAIQPTFNANLKPLLYLLEFADDPSRTLREEIPDFDFSPADRGISVASSTDLKF